jgi:hypothetical protein
MTDINLIKAMQPKSDQLNADDFVAGPMTIKVSAVHIGTGEQPVSIRFEGDNGKPYKPCKSMLRLLVRAWGADSKAFVGRLITLYRDDAVRFGKDRVGGVRISHMSHLDGDLVVPLTVSRGMRKEYTVKTIDATAPVQTTEDLRQRAVDWTDKAVKELEPIKGNAEQVQEWLTKNDAVLKRLQAIESNKDLFDKVKNVIGM